MAYINTLTNQYPVTETDIRNSFPNTSFTQPFLPPNQYHWVFPTPQPDHNPVIMQCLETAPQITALGHYEQCWELHAIYETVEEESEAIAADAEVKRKASIPQKVSRAQFILALLQLGLLDEVEAAIATADRETQINYTERLEFERSYPLIATMAAALGKTELETDALFTLAATL